MLIAAMFVTIVALSGVLFYTRRSEVKAVAEARRLRRVLGNEPLTDLDQVELQLFRCRQYLTKKDAMVPSSLDNLAKRSVLQTASLRIAQAIDHLHVYKSGLGR